MEDSIKDFKNQFDYKPEINFADKIKGEYKHYIICGMGGSHLAAGLLQIIAPEKEIYIHRDYGIPEYSDEFLKNSLLIASSYSGNTEEVLDFADEAYSRGLDLCTITTGGKLKEFSEENKIPNIIMPDTGIQPRTALGFSILAFSEIIDRELLVKLSKTKDQIDLDNLTDIAKDISDNLINKIPVIYTARKFRHIGYNWKIKFNETGKIPAFYNQFPELNHNEMQGYDFVEENKNLSENFYFIFIKDENDHPKVQQRMQVLEELYQEKGLGVLAIYLQGETIESKIFNSLLVADLAALNLAKYYKTEPEQVPLIEDFKKRLK